MPEPEFVTCHENTKRAHQLIDALGAQNPDDRLVSLAESRALYEEAVHALERLEKAALYRQQRDHAVEKQRADLIDLHNDLVHAENDYRLRLP